MKLLRISFDHLKMFEDGRLDIDFYAADKVFGQDQSVHELERPVYTNSIVALAGVNASGKSVALSLIDLALRIEGGAVICPPSIDRGSDRLFRDGTTSYRSLLWHEGSLYVHAATLSAVRADQAQPVDSRLRFDSEAVFKLAAKSVTKGLLSRGFDELAAESEAVIMCEGSGSPRIPNYVSASPLAAESHPYHLFYKAADMPLSLIDGMGGLDEVLRTFDPKIEHLEAKDEGRAYSLRFKGDDEPLLLSRQGLEDVLSSGTLKGVMLVQRAAEVLRHGGYLLCDEIENHLNRQLVNVVLDLFASTDTNPRGAVLVFTTHYPEVLDHVHRKDNVYFLTRCEDGLSRAIKYSEKVERIENKKSEVFVSNYIRGTAPRYSDIAAMRDAVHSAIDGARDE